MSAPVALLGLWTVYERPADYPIGFVARLHHVYAGGLSGATLTAVYGPDLASVRRKLPAGLENLGREPEDDPHIVETWI